MVSTGPEKLEYSRFKSLMINEIETEGLISIHVLLLFWYELFICVVIVSLTCIPLIIIIYYFVVFIFLVYNIYKNENMNIKS